VGNHEDRARTHQVLQSCLDFLLGNGVHAGGGFVENHERRVLQEHPGDGQTLFLPLRQTNAFFANIGLESFWEALNKFPRAGALQRRNDLGFLRIGPSEQEVVAHGAFE